MSRTVKTFSFGYYPRGLINATHDFLVSEGYVYKEKKGEKVYQKGSGLMMGPTFIKVTLLNNNVTLEAWQKFAVLPGLYVGEFDIKSFWGFAVKGPLKKRFAYLENIVLQFGGRPIDENAVRQQMNYQVPVQQNVYQPPVQQPVNKPQQSVQQPQQPAVQLKKAFCMNCGNALEEDAKFCVFCGTKVQ